MTPLDLTKKPPRSPREALVQVVSEEPKFRHWLLQLDRMPLAYRNQQLERMSQAFRIEDTSSTAASAFDRLHDPALVKAVCEFLHDKEASSG
jgi:hypothetical protein